MDPATGGPCQGIRYTIPAMSTLGFSNEVVCLDDPEADFLGRDPFPIHALGRGFSSLGYHPALLSWLVANLERFDAVIVHGIWQWTNIAVWLAVKNLLKRNRTSPPYFIMPHGMLDPWFQKTPGRRLKAARNSLYWHLLQKRVIRNASALLFTSAEELALARKTFMDYRPKREINVGYGVPQPPILEESMREAFLVRCPDLPSDQPYLLFLGRIHPKKGVDFLIRAYAEVFGVQSQSVPALVIAGPIDSDYAREMITLADSLMPGSVFSPNSSPDAPITDSPLPMNRPAIHFTGMLSGDEKWGALYGCEAFVLPSHQENFGVAVVEALACDRPALITNQVNIWREIEQEEAGLVGDDSLDGICRLLVNWRLLRNSTPSHFDPIGCHQRNFSLKKHADRLSDAIYSEISTPHPREALA